MLRDDPEYQERVRKRRAEYQKKHPTTQNTEPQFDKEALKQEIAGMDQQQASLKEKLQKVKDEEKSLTQKVYFDMSGTVEETEQHFIFTPSVILFSSGSITFLIFFIQ